MVNQSWLKTSLINPQTLLDWVCGRWGSLVSQATPLSLNHAESPAVDLIWNTSLFSLLGQFLQNIFGIDALLFCRKGSSLVPSPCVIIQTHQFPTKPSLAQTWNIHDSLTILPVSTPLSPRAKARGCLIFPISSHFMTQHCGDLYMTNWVEGTPIILKASYVYLCA